MSRLRRVGLGRNWKQELDKLCRAAVFARDGHKCVMTGQTATIQWCHVKSRRYLSTRWRLENCLTLSAGKHLWAHHNPLEFANWFNAKYPERALAIEMASSNSQKFDREATRLYLEQELRRYE